MASKKVTIKDVAREAGVSISTVSNALNDVDVLLPETKKHILEVAQKLHYVPNLSGKNLKAQATNTIGMFLTSIRGPYYGTLADSVYQACRQRGYDLQIFISDKQNTLVSTLLGTAIDGAIILNEHVGEREIEMLEAAELPTVFIDREHASGCCGSVLFDSFHEGELAAKYLLELGHKKIMHVYGEVHNFDAEERYRGFKDVLDKAGITFTEDQVLSGLFDRDKSYEAVKAYIESGKPLPDAIFASNDVSAIGTVEALLDEGIRVPEDVSVIGCDDIEIARLVKPSVTTIRTSYDRQGTLAVEQLVSMIKEKVSGTTTTLQGRIIPRESTCVRD